MIEIQTKREIWNSYGVEKPIFQQRETIVSHQAVSEFNGLTRTPKIHLKKAYGDVLDSIRENIRDITRSYPKSASNDFILYVEYLKWTGQAKVSYNKDEVIIRVRKEDVLSLTPSESISRIRRQLYEDGEIDYDDDTRRIRKLAQEDIHNYFISRKEEFLDD